MKIVYVIINFLILAGLIGLFFRKTILAIFRGRRERINRALDEAEELKNLPMNSSEPEEPVLPEAELLCHAELEELKEKTEKEQLAMRHDLKETEEDLRCEMLYQVRSEVIAKVQHAAKELLSQDPYRSMLRKKEVEMGRNILSCVHLTPGDFAYLKTHDVLYVTLTSAFPLPDEIVNEIREYTDQMLREVNGKTSFWVKQDPALIGGFRLRIGDTVYDCTVTEELYHFWHHMEQVPITGNETEESLFEGLKDEIISLGSQVHQYQLGRVLTVSDGICWMDGLADIMYGEVVEFECGERGMVLDIQSNRIGCVIYGSYERIESGSKVRRVGRIAQVPVGEALFGRIVDAVGKPIDGKGRIRTMERRPIECPAPSIPSRSSVNRPLHTGIKAIDALVPIGKGQRELIIGDRQTGKTAIVIDTIINQKEKNVACIYVAIGQKETTIAEIRSKLEKYDAMKYTTIVCASASDSASLQYIAPFAGCAMAEYFMYSGKDALVIYDDISKHAVAYRELSLLLHRPSGREAYPGDIFYLHSRLLERSAQLSPEMGGGSMTALPIVETLAGDISSYIPTNAISITDGQIFLDSELFHSGQRPAVNVGLSVSRVGSAAQTKLMKQVSGSLRIKLAQYRELEGFAQFGAEIDAETQKVLDSGAIMTAALRQSRYEPLPDWKQALLIYAVSEGFAEHVKVAEIKNFALPLYWYFEHNEVELTDLLKTGKKLSDEEKGRLNAALQQYVLSRT